MKMKLWLGIGAFVVVQSGHVTTTPTGISVSAFGSPALAGERGEGEGERGERGEDGERGERGEGEGEGGEGEGGRGRDRRM